MDVAPPEDVMARDEVGNFHWLVVEEVVPLVRMEGNRPESLRRAIERWCERGVLAPYAWKASRAQMLALLTAGRIHGLPPKGRGLYLIHRAGLAHIEDRPRRGWPPGKARPRKGKTTGAAAPHRQVP